MTRDFPADGIRVADTDRDRALAELSEHFQAGRLTQDEFEERSGRALEAKTGDELRAQFTDLPSRELVDLGLDAEQGPAPAPASSAPVRRRSPVPGLVVVCVVAAIAVGNVAVNAGHGHVSLGWLVPVVVLLFVLRRVSRR
jgi:hypothetical protein